MLKQNSLILIREECYRILAVRDNSILAIDCQKRKMPQWQQMPADYQQIDDLELRRITGSDFEDINSVPARRRNIAYQRFTMIAGIRIIYII